MRRHPPNFIPFRVSGWRPKFPLFFVFAVLAAGVCSWASRFMGRAQLEGSGYQEPLRACGVEVLGRFGSEFRVFESQKRRRGALGKAHVNSCRKRVRTA